MAKRRTKSTARLRSMTVKPPDEMDYHVESMAKGALGEHPMLAKLKPKIRQAVMGAMKGMKGAGMKSAMMKRM